MVFIEKSLEQMLEEIKFKELVKYAYLIPKEDIEKYDVFSDYVHLQHPPTTELFREIYELLGVSYSQQVTDAVGFSLENAFVHGNKNQTYLPVSLKIFAGKEGYVFRIRDSGCGFDFKAIIKKFKSNKKYFKYYGWGIKSLCHSDLEVSYEGDGGVVNILVKNELISDDELYV